LSNSSADFYYTPPLSILVVDNGTGQVISQTTQTKASYNWRQDVAVTPDMDGKNINITVTDKNGCVISNRNQLFDYVERTTTNGGTRYNTNWQINSSAQTGDNCGDYDRKISIVRKNPSNDFLDSTYIHLVQSPQNNKYNFSALYLAASNQWVINKENPINTANIYASSDAANNLTIAAPDLISGTYVFEMTTQCKKETITKSFTFPNFLSVSEEPKYNIITNCGFLDIIPVAGQIQSDGQNTTTYFAVIAGEPGGYSSAPVTKGGKLELTIHGEYTIRMYSSINSSSVCGIHDTTIIFEASNIEFNYLTAYVCSPADTKAHVNARGKSGKRPYTYSLYKDINETILLASDTIGDFSEVDAVMGDILYMKIEDVCGASFVSSIDVIDLESLRKAWFGNNGLKELSICEGSTIYLRGISLGDVTYSWTGPNGFADTLQNTQLTILRGTANEGWYYLNVNNSFCPTVVDSVHLLIMQSPSVTIMDNAAICPGTEYTVKLKAHGDAPINYTVVTEINSIKTEIPFTNVADGQEDELKVSPLSTMKIWVKEVNDSQCSYEIPEDTITINIKSISSSCNITASMQEMCYDETAQLTVSSTLDIPYTINWYSDIALTNMVKSEPITVLGQQSTLSIPNVKRDTIFYVTASNDAYCEYKPGITVGSVNMSNNITTINCGEGINFYDTGGPDGNYKNNEDLVQTFVSTANGSPVNITFSSFITEDANYDKMYIYDGGSINSPVLASQLGGDLSANLPGPFVSTGDSLTILFVSNFNNSFAGWNAVVGVENKPVEVIAEVLDSIKVTITSSQPLPIHYIGSTVLSANASGAHGTYNYRWYTSTNGTDFILDAQATTSDYEVTNLTIPTYYKVLVNDNNINACADEAEAVIFLNAADINLTLSLLTPAQNICPDEFPITLRVNNNGTQDATNVVIKILLPNNISREGSHNLEVAFQTIAANSYEELEINQLNIIPSIKVNEAQIKGQIWSCDQGDNNVNTVYGDWDWQREPNEADENILLIDINRVVTNNDIVALNDTVCYGDNAVLEASTTFKYPQTFMWFSDSIGTEMIAEQTLLEASQSPANLTIPALMSDTTVYVTFYNDSICRYTIIDKEYSYNIFMLDGKSDIAIDEIVSFFDSGGPIENYGITENYTYTIVSPSGDPIIVKFKSFEINEATNEILNLYDGNSTNAPLLVSLTGTPAMPATYTTTGNSLTFNFQSNDEPLSGWEAEISTVQKLKPVKAFVKSFADPAAVTVTSTTICPDATADLIASSTLDYPQTFVWYSDSILTNIVYSEIVDGINKTYSTFTLSNQTIDTAYYVTVGNNMFCNLTNVGLDPTGYKPRKATITITQPVVSITGADELCVGAFTTLSPTTGGTWASSDAIIATVTNDGVVTGVSAGDVRFTFTDNTTGCTNITDIVRINALPTINVINIAICYNDDVDLTTAVSVQPGINALFFTDAAASIPVGDPTQVKDIKNNTTFYVKAENSTNFCQSSLQSFNVIVNPLPTLSVQNIAICMFSDADLTMAVSNVVADTLLFYSDQLGTVPVITPNAVNGILSDEVFYVKGLNKSTGCTSNMLSFNVIVNGAPSITLLSNNTPVCEGGFINIEYELENVSGAVVTGLPPGVQTNATATLLTISGTPTIAGTYYYTITTIGQATSCDPATLQASVIVHPNPAASFSYQIEANPLSITFADQSTVSSGSIVSWEWDMGNLFQFAGDGSPFTYGYTTVGIYNVTLKVTTDNGCSASITQTLHTDANVKPGFDIDVENQCISNNRFVFSNTSVIHGTTEVEYLWDFGDGITSSNVNPVHSYTNPGSYPVLLTVTTDKNTISESVQSISKIVNVRPEPPVWVEDLEICLGESVDLTTALLPISGTTVSYYRDAVGTILVSDPTNVIDVESTTFFYVKLLYNVTGCESPLTGFRVKVNSVPDLEVQDIFVCLGNNAVDITPAIVSYSAGSTLQFYRDAEGTQLIMSPQSVSEVTAISPFWVKAVYPNGCESEMKLFMAKVTVLPFVEVKNINVCTGGEVDLNSAVTIYEGSYVQFYEDINGTNPVSSVVTVTNSPATYYARAIYTITGCEGEMESFVVTTNPVPDVIIGNFVYCHGESVPEYTFTGSVTGNNFNWKRVVGHDLGLTEITGTNVIPAFTAQNTGVYPLEAIYEVTPVYTENGVSCEGASEYFMIIVNPIPVLAPVVDMVHCYGTEVEPYLFTSNIPDADYKWKRVGGDVISLIPENGENFMPGFTAMLNNGTALTAQYKVTADFSYANKTCNNGDTITFNITLLPEIKVNITNADQTVCSGTAIQDIVFGSNVPTNNVTFRWERISGVLPGMVTSGTGSIAAQIFTNTGSTSVTALYLVTPIYHYNGVNCEGIPETFSITVMPEIQITAIPDFTFCSGEQVPLYVLGNNPSVNYSWQNDNGIEVGLPDSGTGNLPAFTATNAGDEAITAIYRITASTVLNNVTCEEEVYVSITVNPVQLVDAVSSITLCNNELLEIIFTGSADDYEWERIGGTNIGIPLQGTGNIIDIAVVNITSSPITATYRVRPVGTCPGNEVIFDITVISTPVLNNLPVDIVHICSGSTFDYIASSNTNNVIFSWIRDANPDINNGVAASGNNAHINEVLINTSTNPVVVNYQIMLEVSSCAPVVENIAITVHPAPEIDINYSHMFCTGAFSVIIPYVTTNNPTDYKLIFSDVAIAAGFANIADFTTLPPDEIIIPVPEFVAEGNYSGIITVKKGDCTREYPFEIRAVNSFYIIEQPKSLQNLCSGSSEFELTVLTNKENLTYQWYHNGQAISDATSNTYIAEFGSATAGEYYVEISNVCITLTSDVVFVTENPVTIEHEWDNVIYVKDYDHHFVRFQWYKDGYPVNVNGFAQYYGEEQGLDGTYYARCYYEDGSYIETCPVTIIKTKTPIEVKLYPNPSSAGSTFYVSIDNKELELDSVETYIEIINMLGQVVTKTRAIGSVIEAKAPLVSGTYIVRVYNNTQNITQRMIVK
jgi:PKD repeat protein